MNLKRTGVGGWGLVLLVTVGMVQPSHGQSKEEGIVRNATVVLDEIMAAPEKQIPMALLADARAVVIVPNVVKGGFVVGVRHGKGLVVVRDDQGVWLPPSFVTLTGGSVGWQAGIQSSDVILVFKTRKSVNDMLQRGLTIGFDAAAAAGPVGRNAMAATDPRMQAEIYSYSRSRGLFAGVALDGSAIAVDNEAGMAYYKGANNNPQFSPALPDSAVQLLNRIAQYAGPSQPVPGQPPLDVQAAQPVDTQNHLARSSELVRQQLVSSWQQLSRLLDERWDEYLALPDGTLVGNQPIPAETLNLVLQRYAAIGSNPQYQALTSRHEFVSTYQLLREYATLQSSLEKELTLPPPPPGAANAASPGRF